MVSPDATTRTPFSASPSPPLPTTQPSPTYVPRLRGARPRLHLPGAVARFSRGSVQPPRIICVVVHPPAARPPCRPAPLSARRLFPGHPSGVAPLASSAALALLPRRPFVRSERPFVRTRPGETPPELGPAHHPFNPRPGGRERASGGAGTRVSRPPAGRHRRSAPPAAAPEPRGEHASCARAAPKLFGAAESHAPGRHADVLRLRVRPRLGRRRGRPALRPMGRS